MRTLQQTAALVLFFAACQMPPPASHAPHASPFGVTADGHAVQVVELSVGRGGRARLSEYGASLTELWMPDRDGNLADVVLGFDDLAGYESADNPYFGCTTGRVCNRVREARFLLNGRQYRVTQNHGRHHLHGGDHGLTRVVWSLSQWGRNDDGSAYAEFRYLSADGDEGYPGNLELSVTYTLTTDHVLRIDYRAQTDQPTPVNLTHHSYFNLGGGGTVLDHSLQIEADRYTPTDAELIPTGELSAVEGTALDFRTATRIDARLEEMNQTAALGYDHNFVIRRGGGLARMATLQHAPSGRRLDLWSTDLGLQVYSGNYLDDLPGKRGAIYPRNGGLCLEDQHFPDSVNQPAFPSVILQSGVTYAKTTEYRFSTE